MDYMRHHAIVVTSWDADRLNAAYGSAAGLPRSPIVKGVINEYHSFAVLPDGSKEGWEESDEMDRRRDHFIERLRKLGEGGYLEWVEVAFGSDDARAEVTRSAWLDEIRGDHEDL